MDLGLAPYREHGAEPIPEDGGIANIAFPQRNHAPAQCLKGLGRGGIALDIARQLRNPVVAARPRHIRELAAGVLMPKASMDLDDCAIARQDDVRLTGQVAPMQPEPVAHGMEASANKEFRLRVLLPVTPHDPRPGCRDGGGFYLHPISCNCAASRHAHVRVAARRAQRGLGSTRTARLANVSR